MNIRDAVTVLLAKFLRAQCAVCRRRSWLFHDFSARLTVEKFCTTASPIETTPQVDRSLSPAAGAPDQFAALIKKDIALWRKEIQDGNIKVE